MLIIKEELAYPGLSEKLPWKWSVYPHCPISMLLVI